ncbi:type II secretion system protein GspG [Luteolibacter flavescens]|uniref:Type II secretion system protein GspG n=1 Tax=Luteolibacter flavescens TaxID=1859460 RepID=A0ABT3FPX3_9BACT|nr:type II secretion system protein GspG [Luteolibacter flavescens]MCW1885040.1 type II secretion system protein GspG [Luteolibacter flavescens]
MSGIGGVQQDIGHLQFVLRDFRLMLGGNPVGNNAEIISALNGRNPRKVVIKLWDGHRLNDEGELVDPWGTPYFFHQISSSEMEIRCAGPDRIMWNSDDLNFR